MRRNMTIAPHPLDEAIRLTPIDTNRFAGHTSPAYWGQVAPFGGVTAATILNAALLRPERLGDPLTLTVNYAGPIRPGPFEVETRLMRTNRSTQHWAVQLVQGDAREVMISAIVVFAVRRPTWSRTEARMPDVPAAAACPTAPRGRDMAWLERYDLRPVRGRLMQPNPDSITHGWIADHPARALDFPALASICDAFFPRLFLLRPTPTPIGTVSLNVYFHVDSATLALQGSAPVLGVAEGQVYNAGFFDQHGQLWGEGGVLLATTHQIVWYKE